MMKVAENYNIPYQIVDPNDNASIGLNPFVYENPLKAAGVFSYVLKAMYQGTLNDIEKVIKYLHEEIHQKYARANHRVY